MGYHKKDLRHSVFTAAVLTISFLAAGSGQEVPSSAALTAVSTGNTLFAKNLYSVLRANNDGNLICSPLSISAVIAMIQGGAKGDTAKEIRNVLHFPSNAAELNSGYKDLLQSLRSNENFTLEIANNVYSNVGFEINPDYQEILSQYFGVEIQQLNFAQPGPSADKINAWVERVTHNKIKNLIHSGDLDDTTRLVLINGIYFKGFWTKKFDPSKTFTTKFYVSSASDVEVDMMNIEETFPYAEIKDLDAKAVSLPYQGGRMSMIIILPNKKFGLAEMETKLKDFDLSTLPSLLRDRKVNLQMPKFTLESTIDLKAPLMQLGLKSMFEQDADFTGIPKNPLQDPLYVSKAIQKAFIEVNEEGSEAAAATGVVLTVKSAIVLTIKDFIVEHPFVAYIYDTESNAQLFWSTVTNPLVIKTELKNSEVSTEEGSQKPGGRGASPTGQQSAWTLISLGLFYAFQRAL